MRKFIITCTTLMFTAGFYGAADMVSDLGNGNLIDYDNVRERHAMHLLAIIKTVDLPVTRYAGAGPGTEKIVRQSIKNDKEVQRRKAERSAMYEVFSRGDIEMTLRSENSSIAAEGGDGN